MRYCERCGKQLKEDSNYCSYCGASTSGEDCRGYRTYEYRGPEPASELHSELAYTGVLFWVPLVFSKEPNRKIHTNRGLWILILAVITCTIGNVIRYALDGLGGN